MKVANHIPPAPGEVADNIPLCVDQFVMRLMANRPEKRPASASDAIEEVQQLITQLKNSDAFEIWFVCVFMTAPQCRGKVCLRVLSPNVYCGLLGTFT